MTAHRDGRRETFRRTLKEKKQLDLKDHPSRKRKGDIMTIAKSPVVTMAPTTPIYEAIQVMVKAGFRRMPIVQNEKLIGIVTVMDILRFFGSGHVFNHLQSRTITQILQTKILDIAVRDIVAVGPEVEVGQAAKLMRDRKVGALPVVQKERLVDIITERDFFKLIA